jgi:spermidine synthase
VTVDRALYGGSTETAIVLQYEPDAARVYWPTDPTQPDSEYSAEYWVKFGYLTFDDFGPRDAGYWWGMREAQLPNAGMLDGVASANNFEPLLVGRYVDLLDAVVETPALLRLMGVTHVSSDRLWPGGEPIHVNETATLYRLPDPLGRAWVVPAARQVPPEEVLAALADPAFDPAAEVLLEHPISNIQYPIRDNLARRSQSGYNTRYLARTRVSGTGRHLVSGLAGDGGRRSDGAPARQLRLHGGGFGCGRSRRRDGLPASVWAAGHAGERGYARGGGYGICSYGAWEGRSVMERWKQARQFIGLMLLSCTVLTLEVLLTRAVSVLYYPVGVYFVISIALLGSAAGGVFVAIAARSLKQRMAFVPSLACLGLSLGTVVALVVMVNTGAESLSMVPLALAIALPFLGGGLAVSVLFNTYPAQAHRLYLADLAGAGLGAVLASVILLWVSVQHALILTVCAAGLVAVLLGVHWRTWQRILALAAVLGVALLSPVLAARFSIPALPPKELGLLFSVRDDVRVGYQGWSPVARVDVVSVPGDRIRLPEALDYKLITQDGGAPSMILSAEALNPEVTFTDHTILGIPYWIKPHPEVLIVGLGGGPDVVTALRYGARRVVGVEINRRMIEVVSDTFADFAGAPYADPRVEVILGDGRHVIEASTDRFDIIQLTGVDTAVASVGASPNLAENYLYTVEAFKAYFTHLKPGGLLSISFPNVEGLGVRMFAVGLRALDEMGVEQPLDSMVLSETGGFVHLLVKWQQPFTVDQVQVLSQRFEQEMFGIYFPLYHRLMGMGSPDFFSSHRLLWAPHTGLEGVYLDYYEHWRAGDGPAWMARQPIEVRPTTDDWPFFFIRDRWFTYMPTLSLLLFILGILLFFALLFLVVPLVVFRRQGMRSAGVLRLVSYFVCLGHERRCFGRSAAVEPDDLGDLWPARGLALGSGVLPVWAAGIPELGRPRLPRERAVKHWLRPWAVVLILGLVYVGLTLARYSGDPLAFALVGTRYGEGDSQGTEGYDGQFAYFIARDPAGGWRHCDVPAYRYQRVLYPLLAWALGLGQPGAVGWTLIGLNLVALAGGTYFTERLLAARGVSRWYALAYGLYGGLVAGLRLDLTEPLAYGLVQGALWAWEGAGGGRQEAGGREQEAGSRGGSWPFAMLLLALAALAKETALIAAGGLLLYLALERRWREAVTLGVGVGLPFVAWQVALWAWLGEPGVGAGGAMATSFELLPFAGLWRVATASWSVFWLLLAIEGPLFVVPTVWALVASAQDLLRGRRHPWITLLLVQAAVLPFLPFSTWREPLAMARLAAGLVGATLLYGARRRSRRVLTFSLFWLATLALLVNESDLPI